MNRFKCVLGIGPLLGRSALRKVLDPLSKSDESLPRSRDGSQHTLPNIWEDIASKLRDDVQRWGLVD
jgi:hypothetical protein